MSLAHKLIERDNVLAIRRAQEPGRPSLRALFQSQRDDLLAQAAWHGAVLFRGFDLDGRAAFDAFVQENVQACSYLYGNSPRSQLTEAVYTSTEFPPEFAISFHNELSYCASWPRHLLFFASLAPEHGGETPLVNSHALWSALPRQLRERFDKRGLIYIRNLHAGQGLGPSWMKTFGTTDRQQVEQLCAAGDIRCAWRADGSLRLSERRPATQIHPDTGETLWFNQADQFHPTNHPAQVREALADYFKGREHDMPHHCLFGDGSALDPAELSVIRETASSLATAFRWETGDLLLIDNMTVAHGRNPYRGAREILVSMF